MPAAASVTGSLRRKDTTRSTMQAVRDGLPVQELDRLARALAPADAKLAYKFVPRATLARRRAANPDGRSSPRLSPAESAKVARVRAVWQLALEVWKSEAAARRFMFGPHMLLGDRPPFDVVLENEFGRPAVEGILGSLLYGTAL